MSRRKRDFDYLGRTVLVWVFCRTIQVSGLILQNQRCIVLDTDGPTGRLETWVLLE